MGQVTANTAQNEIQTVTISGAPTGGTFSLLFAGQLAAGIAFNATAATVQAALQALSTIGSGNATVTGSAGGPWTVTFAGALGNLNQPLMTAINSLTGGTTPSIAIAETQVGNPGFRYFKPYASGNTDGSQVAKGLLQYDCSTDTQARVTVGGSDYSEQQRAVPIIVSGTFKTADLTGIDATSVGNLGRLISGSTSLLTDSGTLLRMG